MAASAKLQPSQLGLANLVIHGRMNLPEDLEMHVVAMTPRNLIQRISLIAAALSTTQSAYRLVLQSPRTITPQFADANPEYKKILMNQSAVREKNLGNIESMLRSVYGYVGELEEEDGTVVINSPDEYLKRMIAEIQSWEKDPAPLQRHLASLQAKHTSVES